MSLTNFSKRKDKISVRDHIEIANVEIATVEGRASCCSCSKCWGRIRIDLFVVVVVAQRRESIVITKQIVIVVCPRNVIIVMR